MELIDCVWGESKGEIVFWKELNVPLKRELGGKTPQNLD